MYRAGKLKAGSKNERSKYGKSMQIKEKSHVLRYREKHRNESPASVACDTYQRFLSVFLTLVDADEDKNVHVSHLHRSMIIVVSAVDGCDTFTC